MNGVDDEELVKACKESFHVREMLVPVKHMEKLEFLKFIGSLFVSSALLLSVQLIFNDSHVRVLGLWTSGLLCWLFYAHIVNKMSEKRLLLL